MIKLHRIIFIGFAPKERRELSAALQSASSAGSLVEFAFSCSEAASSIERLLESADADTTASVWLPVGVARPAIMAELCRFHLPTILCARKDNARALARAACLQAEYPNVRGVAPYPFRNAVQKKICSTLLEKIRNAQTLALFLRDMDDDDNNDLESPQTQDSQNNNHQNNKTQSNARRGALLYAEARSNYTALVFAERRPNALALGNGCREKIRAASLGKLLNAQDLPLVRVHKSFAVNPAVVREVSLTASSRDYNITLANGKKIPLSRPYRRILEHLPAPIVAGGGGVEIHILPAPTRQTAGARHNQNGNKKGQIA